MSRLRILDGLAVAVAVGAALGLGFVTRPSSTGLRPADAESVIVNQAVTTVAAPTALFIGDSYTIGNGLAERAYTCRAARIMGWLCELGAQPGTGYVSGGSANRFVGEYVGASTSMVERIPQLATAYRPDFVILDGGRKDTFVPLERAYTGMQSAIGSARRAWPGAVLVFVRPRFLAQPENDLGYDDAFIERLRLEQPGLVIIDPIAMLIGRDTTVMLQDDGIHPNEEGEIALATVLTIALQSSGIAAGS